MFNKIPQVSIIFNRRNRASSGSPAPIEIRISCNRRQKFISTGIRLLPHQWKEGRIVNHPQELLLSQTLDRLVSDVRQAVLEMVDEGSTDLSSIPRRLQRFSTPKSDFLHFCEERTAIRKYGKRKDTQERYERFLRLFRGWGRIVYFEDINERNILLYDEHLRLTGMKPYSRWNNYHRFLNSFIMDAIDDGLLQRNPYRWVNIDKQKRSKGLERCLTPEEFRKLKSAPMPTNTLTKVRDLFVFQTYTCLSYSDLRDFDPRSIRKVRGMNVYTGRRHKTGMSFTIPLLSPALNILHRYEGHLPVISNAKYNAYLKAVAQEAGIDKPLSTHWARHTGATMLLNEGVPMQIVSKICGHSSTRITEQVYAKLLDETVVDAISGIDLQLF